MTEVVFARGTVWFPTVVRESDELRIRLGAGADSNHDPRTFSFPIEEPHLVAIRDDLARHLLLWSAVLPLCYDAGTRGPLDEAAAVDLLAPILLAEPAEVDALFQRIRWHRDQLIAQGADIDLLEKGRIWNAMRSATETSDWHRVQEYDANRRRAEAGVVLAPLDAAILRFTGQYLHGGASIPRRSPDAVDAALLPDVLQIVAVAERACAGMEFRLGPRRATTASDKQDWGRMSAKAEAAVRGAHPELTAEAVRSVGFLVCSEAAARARMPRQ